MDSRKVRIEFLKQRPSDIALKHFFSSQDHSGVKHGTIKTLKRTGDDEVELEFSHAEDAAIVCKKRTYKWKNGTEICVSLCDEESSGNDDDDEIKRTVLLEAPSDLHKDDLEIFLEDEGEIEKIDMSNADPGIAKIIFKSTDVAAKLVIKGEVMVDETTVKVRKYETQTASSQEQSSSSDYDAKTLYISCVDPSWSQRAITKYFEKKGGEIVNINFDDLEQNGQVMVQYKEIRAIERLSQETLSYRGKTMLISRPSNSEPRKIEDENTHTLRVENIPTTKTKKFVRLFFQNKNKSGGGPIKDLDYEAKGEAIIVFKDVSDAADVLSKPSLTIEGQELQITRLDDSYSTDKTCAILISGDIAQIDRDTLDLHFEEQGGGIEESYISEDKSTAVITYEKQEFAEIVLQKRHKVEGIALHVQKIFPALPPPLITPPVEERILLLREVSSATSEEIKRYIEPVADCNIQKIAFSCTHKGIILLEFDKEPDFNQIRSKTIKKPFKDKMINVGFIPKSSIIQIHNIDDSNDQYLQMLIQNIDGNKVEDIDIYEEPLRYALAHIPNTDLCQLIDKLTKKKKKMIFRKFHKSFGVEPLAETQNTPSSWYTNDLEVKIDETEKLKPFLENELSKVLLNKSLQKENMQIRWPPSPEGEVFLCRSASQHDPQPAENWDTCAKEILAKELDRFETVTVVIKKELWQEFKGHLDDIIKENSDSVVISPNEENLSVGIFGAHEDVSLTEQQLRPYQAADESRPTDIRSLLLEGVNSSIHPDILQTHLEDLVREDSTIESIDSTKQLDTGKVIVTYTNPQDAQQLLSLHEIHIDGNPIYITPHIIDTELTTDTVTNARKQDMFLDEETRQRTVIIEGINPTWTDDVIEKFFKQPKIGGGEIESLAKEKHDNTAVMISYKESSNAKNILEHRKFDYAGQSLYTRPHQLPEPVFTLEVTGIPKKTTKDFIELYFENKRESGGGNIRRMSYKTGDSKATVTFEDCKDAMEVLQKMDHWLEIGDEKYLLTILALDVTYTTNKICAIRVSKFTDKINQKYLKVYFGNRRKSGGGKIKEIYFDEENKYAVITFESPDVIKRIIQKRNHCLENELLKVTVLDTAPFPTAIHTPCESVALILNHVTPSITSQILTTYFKEATDCDIKEIRYSWEHQGVVELLFEAIPEFEKVRDHIQQKPILGRMCSIQKVPKPRSLQIYNIGKLSEDYMDGFLGKDDLAGELLVRAKVYAKPTAHCIADFRVGTDLPLIIKEINKEHGEMQVFPYNTSFGLVPPKTSLRGPDTWFPKQVELEQPSKNIAEFLSKNTTQQNLLEQLIKSKNGKLTWPTLIHEKINVSYEPNAFESADKTWATDIKTAIQGFLHNFTEERINILHQIWPSFKQQIKKCDTDYIKCILDDETNSLICIGTIDEVRKVKRIAQEKKGKLEEELRKQNSITTDIITLNKYQVFLLEANDFSRKMDSVAKSTDISLNVDECKVKIKGVPGNIDEVKLEMHKMIATIVDKKLTISSALVKIASRSNATKYINNLIQQCGVKLYWIVEHDAIVLYAMSNGELSKGENLFSEHLDEKTLTLNSAHAKVLKSDKGKLFIKEQNEKSDDRVELSISASAITLRGTSDKVYTLYEDIDAFIKEHAKIEKFFEVPLVGVVRYLYQSIDNIKKEFEDESVPVIEQKLDGTKPGFLIKGTFKTCKKAEDILRKRTKNIKAIEIPTNQQGIVEYFTLKDGRDILAGKELRYKVAIEAAKDTNVPLLGGGEAGEKDSPIEKTSVEYSGVKLVVAQADLPTYKCDAIVNAANEKMEHYGGLAAAIVKRGGKEIQEECSNYVRNYGQLISPDVYVSSAGKLFCKNIIHAVGPRWNAGRDGEENKLFEVIYELLTKAKEKNFRTIAIPAISTGIFRFPMALALATILDAIKEFCDKEGAAGNLKEIHLVDFTDDIANAMKEAVHKKFGVPRVKERKRLIVSDIGRIPTTVRPATHRGGNNELIINVRGKFVVTVAGGDITDERTDVIVHGSDSNLGLGGVIGPVLIKKAGKVFEDECKSKGKITNLVEFTTSGNLQCKTILHVDVGGTMTVDKWRNAFLACLKAADAKGYTSISFPALGTGNLRHKPEVISDILIEVFKEYAQSSNPQLKDIRMIIYQNDMLRTFQNRMERKSQSITVQEYEEQMHETVGIKSEELTLVVYGESEEIIEKVKDEINEHIASQIEVVSLESEADQRQISILNPTQIERIKEIGGSNNVQLTIKRGHRHNQIKIQGDKSKVHFATKKIEEIMRETTVKDYASILAKQVQWEYCVNGLYTAYPEDINARIEGDYQRKKAYSEWKEFDQSDGVHYSHRIIFKDKTEVLTGTSKPPVQVRRTEHDGVPFPKTWSDVSDIPTGEVYKEDIVIPHTPEYKNVSDKFHADTNNQYTIYEMKRIQNPSLYKQLKIKEKQMETTSSTRPITRYLWHGTSEDTIQKINSGGFNRSYCGKNATVYGQGAYFAQKADYSCGYAVQGAGGFKYIYYCTVLTGDYTKGDSSFKDAPAKNSNNPHIKYDSVVDNPNNIVMFVVFNDTQACPDYLIKFK